jgi:hypothetical protein
MAPKEKKKAADALGELDKDREERKKNWKQKAAERAAELRKKDPKSKPRAKWDVKLSAGPTCLRFFLCLANVGLFIFSIWLLIRITYNKAAHVYVLLDTWFTPALVVGSFFLLLSILGVLAAWFLNRIALWVYVLFLLVIGFTTMVASSYSLSKLNDGASFLRDAWLNAPDSVILALEGSLACCGLNSFMDADASLPCPPGSYIGNMTASELGLLSPNEKNATGIGCMGPMLAQFDQYSYSVPTAGLVLWVMVTIVAFFAGRLARSISAALKETSHEEV